MLAWHGGQGRVSPDLVEEIRLRPRLRLGRDKGLQQIDTAWLSTTNYGRQQAAPTEKYGSY